MTLDEALDGLFRTRKSPPDPHQAVQTAFSAARKEAGRMQQDGGSDRVFDLDGPLLRRRKKAVVSFLPQVRQACALQPDPEQEQMAEERWIRMTTSAVRPLDALDRGYGLTPAAALFLLDHLPPDRREAAEALLPDPARSLPWVFPEISLPDPDAQFLRGMVSLIRERDGEPDKWWYNRATARPLERRRPKSEAFARIWEMVPDACKRQAAAAFQSKLREFTDRIFQGSRLYRRTSASHLRTLHGMFDQLQVYDPDLSSALNQISLEVIQARLEYEADRLDPFGGEPAPQKKSLRRHKALHKGLFPSLMASEHILVEEFEKAAAFQEREQVFLARAPLIPMVCADVLEKGDRLAWEPIRSFQVEDPFEICFGFLCLMEEDSDLPWLCAPAVGVLLAAARKLPWTACLARIPDWDGLHPEQAWFRNAAPDEDEDETAEGEAPASLSFPNDPLKPWYPGSWIAGSQEEKLSLAQLVCGKTGALLPRAPSLEQEDLKALQDSGLPEERTQFLSLLFQVLRSAPEPRRTPSPLPEENAAASVEPPPEAPKEEKPVWPRIEELRHTLREQEVEYRALQRELYQADHTVRDRQAGNARLEESGQGRRRELQDLREVLYALLNGTEPEREAGKSAASDGFSRLLPRTVTVFGGKEAWRRKMKQLLPGVNCRKADGSLRLPEKGTIWIQPRGLTPRRYTALLDAIRQAGLPVRYFLSETAEQCAEELIAGEE